MISPSPAVRRLTDRYRAAGCRLFRMGQDSLIAYDQMTNDANLISNFVGHILLHCRDYKTIQEHINACEGSFSHRISRPTLELIFEHLVNRGMMIRAQAAKHEKEYDIDSCAINTLAFPTRDRNLFVNRALLSYLKAVNRDIEISIHDNTYDASISVHSNELLQSFLSSSKTTIRCSGRLQRDSFVQCLAANGKFDRKILEFALGTSSESNQGYGATRNSILLDTVGEPFLSADDDTICHLLKPPIQSTEITLFTGNEPPQDVWFFESDGAALASGKRARENILGLHERVLGRRLAELVRADSATLKQASVAEGAALPAQYTGSEVVRLTQMGVAGDSGMAAPNWLTLNQSSFMRWIESEQSYRFGMTTRSVIRAARSYLVSPCRFFMSTVSAYDNRKILPPFSPLYRNEDGLFSVCLGKVDGSALVGHVPFCVAHIPHEYREFTPNCAKLHNSRCRVNDLLILLISACGESSLIYDPEGKMRSLGHYLKGLSSFSVASFQELLRHSVWKAYGELLKELEIKYLACSDLPSYFLKYFDQYRRSQRLALMSPEYVLPHEMAEDRNEGLEQLQRYFHQFGELLCLWPDIVRATRELQREGLRISRTVYP